MSRTRTLRWRLATGVVLALVGTAAGVNAQSAPIPLSPEQAVALAMAHNLTLKSQRLGPRIAELDVAAARTAWTPALFTRMVTTDSTSPSTTAFDAAGEALEDRRWSSEAGVTQRLSWGASYQVRWDGGRHETNSVFARFAPELQSSVAASFVQPLFKGLFIDSARAERQVTTLARQAAESDLDGAVAATKRQVLLAYWNWVFARDFLAVQRQSLALAQALLDGNRRRVSTGAMAPVDAIEAEAEVARRREAILIAEKHVANAEDVLRMHIFDADGARATLPLEPSGGLSDPPTDPNGSIQRALVERQDLKALRAAVAIDSVNVRRLRNDRLPDASVRIDYARRGTGGTELIRGDGFPGPVVDRVPGSFASVLDDLARTRYRAWSVELAVSYPIGPARAEAEAARAALLQQQREATLRAAEQRVVTEVQAAIREVATNEQRLETTALAVRLSERRLDGEQRKFAAGLSTSFFVFQAQRDLAQAREAELKSVLDHRVSIVDLEAVQTTPLAR